MFLVLNDADDLSKYIVSLASFLEFSYHPKSQEIHYVFLYAWDEKWRDVLLSKLKRSIPMGTYGHNPEMDNRNVFTYKQIKVVPMLYEDLSKIDIDRSTLAVVGYNMDEDFINKLCNMLRKDNGK
jgi:hypothetical protein